VNTQPRASDAEHFAYAATHSHEHPLAPVWEAESRSEAVYRLSDHISRTRWRQTEFYRLGQPTNQFSLVQSYRLGRGGMGTFALERDRRDFTGREMALLALGYSAYRAMAEKLRLASVEGERRAVVEAHLREVAEASLQADQYGRILSATTKARRLLATLGATDQLPIRLAGWWQACLVRPGERRPLVHVEPGRANKWLKATCLRAATKIQSGMIRLVEEPGTDEARERLAGEFGLSRREAECLLGLQRGRTNSELAREMNVSVRTVENFIARLYAKLGVTSRLAAVRRADAIGE
jgi:DNA-binding CsgD family transcriptional regulator